MPKVLCGEGNQNTDRQKKLYTMHGHMLTVTEKLKKENSESYGKFKLVLPAEKILAQLVKEEPEKFEKIVKEVEK